MPQNATGKMPVPLFAHPLRARCSYHEPQVLGASSRRVNSVINGESDGLYIISLLP